MFISKTLANGVRVVVEKLPEIRSVTLGIWVKAGSAYETAGENGISHYIEHMLFKGTERRSYREIAREIDRIGGQINAFTGREFTCFYAKVIDEKQAVATDVLTDMFCHSLFLPDEMEKERGVVLEEISMSKDAPDDVAFDTVGEEFFRGTALSQSILGPAENVKRFRKSDIDAYLRRRYTAENTVVVAVGNVATEPLFDALERLELPHTADAERCAVVPRGWEPQAAFRAIAKDTEQMNLCIAMPAYAYLDPRKYAVSAIANVLGGSMSSRLFQKIREELGMAYSVYCYTSTYAEAGSLTVYAGNSPENTLRVTDAILDILKDFRMTPEELSDTKAQLRGNFILSQESMSAKMKSIGKNMMLRGAYLTEGEVLEHLEALTMREIDAAIDELFDQTKLCGVFVGPLREEAALRGRFHCNGEERQCD